MADREKLIEVLTEMPGMAWSHSARQKVADHLIANGVTLAKDTNVPSKIAIRYKDFEIRPTVYLDGHKEPNKYDVVKWEKHKPREVYDLTLGRKRMSDRGCFSIAHIYWNEKEPCWEFESVGTRFLEYYEDGLCEFVREWLELIGEPAEGD